jgi:hypothetical protein
MQRFDKDYEDWRSERRKKFSDEFDKWRSSRSSETSDKSGESSAAAMKNK